MSARVSVCYVCECVCVCFFCVSVVTSSVCVCLCAYIYVCICWGRFRLCVLTASPVFVSTRLFCLLCLNISVCPYGLCVWLCVSLCICVCFRLPERWSVVCPSVSSACLCLSVLVFLSVCLSAFPSVLVFRVLVFHVCVPV